MIALSLARRLTSSLVTSGVVVLRGIKAKVLDAVVCLHAIDVVNDLTSAQWATKMSLHDESVFEHALVGGYGDPAIPPRSYPVDTVQAQSTVSVVPDALVWK